MLSLRFFCGIARQILAERIAVNLAFKMRTLYRVCKSHEIIILIM